MRRDLVLLGVGDHVDRRHRDAGDLRRQLHEREQVPARRRPQRPGTGRSRPRAAGRRPGSCMLTLGIASPRGDVNRRPVRRGLTAVTPATGQQARGAPQRHPAGQVRLDRQLAGERGRGPAISSRLSRALRAGGRERVERALLVEVDQPDPATRSRPRTAPASTAARGRTPRLQRGVDRVQVRAQPASVSSGSPVHQQPGEAELVAARSATSGASGSPLSSATTSSWVCWNAAPAGRAVADRAVAGRASARPRSAA